MGVTRLDKIRNEYIRRMAHIDWFGCKLRESRLRWFGRMQRRDEDYVGEKNHENGAARKEKKRKTKEKVHGYSERGLASDWSCCRRCFQ